MLFLFFLLSVFSLHYILSCSLGSFPTKCNEGGDDKCIDDDDYADDDDGDDDDDDDDDALMLTMIIVSISLIFEVAKLRYVKFDSGRSLKSNFKS